MLWLTRSKIRSRGEPTLRHDAAGRARREDLELGATVSLPALVSGVVVDRYFVAEALRVEPFGVDAVFDQPFLEACGAPRAQALVQRLAAALLLSEPRHAAKSQTRICAQLAQCHLMSKPTALAPAERRFPQSTFGNGLAGFANR